MARPSIGLARRLVDFVSTFVTPQRPRPARRWRGDAKHWLAVELLGTLSPQVLAETGHDKRRAARVARPRSHPPSPPPVGDLARPRS